MHRLAALALLATGCWPALPTSREGFACRIDADCAGGTCVAQVCTTGASGGGGGSVGDGDSSRLPLRVSFYQVGYPQAWGSGASPQTVDVASLGRYSSTDTAVVRAHVAALRYARIDGAVVFWGGPGSSSDVALGQVMEAAAGEPVRWAVYDQEDDGANPSVAQIRATLDAIATGMARRPNYLRLDGRPVEWRRSRCDTASHHYLSEIV